MLDRTPLRRTPLLALCLTAVTAMTACTGPGGTQNRSSSNEVAATYSVVPFDKVPWTQLNPARGDKSPQAGALWGDRIGRGPAGFILKPVDGFRSPPHIHNIAYRGVVIAGLLHNDDPEAADMWMPQGSFWTQPAGEVHITAGKGDLILGYIEVDGAFGVLPADKAFKDKQRPVNVDASNIVWLDASTVSAIAAADAKKGPKIAYLWGRPVDGTLNGTLIKLPAGGNATLATNGSAAHAVVIAGLLSHRAAGQTEAKPLAPGSYFGSKGPAKHHLTAGADEDCVIYVRTKGALTISSD